jgi:hypothetical protein
VSEVSEVFSSINQDMTLLSQRMDHRHQESAAIKGDVQSLLERFQELEERIMTLEAANVEKEGCIDMLESLVDSMLDQLCHCADKSPQVGSGSGSKEDPFDLDLSTPLIRVLIRPIEHLHRPLEVLSSMFSDWSSHLHPSVATRPPRKYVLVPQVSLQCVLGMIRRRWPKRQ